MKLFIFDMGEVILLDIRTIRQISDYIGADFESVRDDYLMYDMALMDGYMSPEDYYRHLEDKYQVEIDEDLFSIFFHPTANSWMLSQVDALRERGHRCVIGSNTFKPHWDIISALPDRIFDHFDALYASHIMHMSKPEPSFWRIICSQEGFAYADTIFIDDLQRNIDAAASLGIRTLHYAGDGRNERAEAFFGEYL